MALEPMAWRERIINIIKDGIEDSALGAGSSRLVLRTGSLVYDLSTAEKILKQPEQFEVTLNKILGKKGSQEAIESIVDRLKNEMLFEHWAA
jgi:hypothetical protein